MGRRPHPGGDCDRVAGKPDRPAAPRERGRRRARRPSTRRPGYLSPTWLLDTSVRAALINRVDEQAAARLLEHPRGSVRLCSVVKAELHFGAQNSSRLAENLQRVEIFCRAFESLPFDDESARQYGIVRARLGREGRPIGGNDLMIASIAVANSHVLVTRNVGELSRVTGLEVDRWQPEGGLRARSAPCPILGAFASRVAPGAGADDPRIVGRRLADGSRAGLNRRRPAARRGRRPPPASAPGAAGWRDGRGSRRGPLRTGRPRPRTRAPRVRG